MKPKVFAAISCLVLVTFVQAPALGQEGVVQSEPHECEVDPASCTPVVTSDGIGILNVQVGRLVSDYIWAYDDTVHFKLCSQSGCIEVGSALVGARTNLNGRQSQWSQYSDSLGPAIKATHTWDCVDDNGSLPNTSCGSGNRTNSVYTTSRWTTSQNNYHQDNETYWYNFDYFFKLSGYTQTWTWTDWQSYKFICKNQQTNPCRYRW